MQPTSQTCRTRQPTSGGANGNWKGGKTHHKAGFVKRRVPGHPRARPRSPYVFEHVFVTEDELGRTLLPDGSVHHLNRVKDDNRIENLELWVLPQPSGIRASDTVEWAKEILRRYEGASGSSNNRPRELPVGVTAVTLCKRWTSVDVRTRLRMSKWSWGNRTQSNLRCERPGQSVASTAERSRGSNRGSNGTGSVPAVCTAFVTLSDGLP